MKEVADGLIQSQKDVRALLFPTQLLLLEDYTKFFIMMPRMSIVQAFQFAGNWGDISVTTHSDPDKFLLTLKHPNDGVAKGAWYMWCFNCGAAARPGWTEYLMDALQGAAVVRKEKMEQSKRTPMHGRKSSMDWTPAPPPRSGQAGPQALQSMVDELRKVQATRTNGRGIV